MDPTVIGVVDELGLPTTLLNDPPALRGLAFLFLLQFLGSFLPQEQLKRGHEEFVSMHLENSSTTYPELLLPLRCHETFLGLLGFGGLLHARPHLGPLAVDFRLLLLLLL